MIARVELGECVEVLAAMACGSIDAVVTDPPYHLTSNVRRFRAGARASAGFMGKAWDGGDIAFRPETWAGVLRVLKPGGHLVAFAAPKNSHRMVCAIEDAGFEIRDGLMWLYGSGFPKSRNVSKAIDKAAGAEREDIGPNLKHHGGGTNNVYAQDAWTQENFCQKTRLSAPATDAARQWEGWGTALKPAYEPICLARKPLSEGTVTANVLRWGTGAINVDACRVGLSRGVPASHSKTPGSIGAVGIGARRLESEFDSNMGRWPANVAHDGSDEVVGMFPSPHGAGAAQDKQERWADQDKQPGWGNIGLGANGARFGDSGSAARFFWSPKADADERLGSSHPTVKPVALMRWLVRMVCPQGGTVLDPFAGTGVTGEAAMLEGMNAILIEKDEAHVADIRRRLAHVYEGRRVRAETRVRTRGQIAEPGPLFE